MKLAVIKYNAGNIRSLSFALERLGIAAKITADPEEITSADKVIFPGVGEASSTMSYLLETGLHQLIPKLRQPTLGICLGMQLMCSASEENNTTCLGIFPEVVQRIPAGSGLKVPHMGWNTLENVCDWLPASLTGQYAYFVHSYAVPVNTHTSAICHYGIEFSAALHRDNFYAVQFHPEKSAECGAAILKSFLDL